MDGYLRPNNLLDEAAIVTEVHQPDNAINVNGELWFSSGSHLLKLNLFSKNAKPELLSQFDEEISSIAAGPADCLAIGLDNGKIFVQRSGNHIEFPYIGDQELKCPTALGFIDENRLLVCQGSEHVKPSKMNLDLMRAGSSGSVWILDLTNGSQNCISSGLGFPYGIVVLHKARKILVSECWRHRILGISLDGSAPVETVLSDLQGYPARLFPTSRGKTMLCLFAARNRLIEFVLKEDEFRRKMIEAVDQKYWIAPQLKTGENFLEPLQQGGVKTMNIHKPWAPSLSYGLLVRLGPNHSPEASFHSRSNSNRHGITSGCEVQCSTFVTSKGGDCILEVSNDC